MAQGPTVRPSGMLFVGLEALIASAGPLVSFAAVALEREKGARNEQHNGRAKRHARMVTDFLCGLPKLNRKQHPAQPANEGEPAENGHQHWPRCNPAVVGSHDGKARDEHEDARQVDKGWVARALLDQRGRSVGVRR
jgi:hypothetical protein